MRHRVHTFITWQRVFLEEAETRRANGMLTERLFRSETDASEVWLLLEWDDLFRARLFVKSDHMQEALTRGGVIDQPDYWYLEDANHVLP